MLLLWDDDDDATALKSSLDLIFDWKKYKKISSDNLWYQKMKRFSFVVSFSLAAIFSLAVALNEAPGSSTTSG